MNGVSFLGKHAAWLATLVLVAGCASTPEQAPQIQRISPEELERIMPKQAPNLSLDEIVQLSQAKLSSEEIIQKIKDSHSQYALTPSQVLEMGKKGVDAKVLDYIQASHEQAIRDGFADELNKREQIKLQEQQKLKREYQLRQPYYDPYWGYPYPYYGPRFRYQFGF